MSAQIKGERAELTDSYVSFTDAAAFWTANRGDIPYRATAIFRGEFCDTPSLGAFKWYNEKRHS
jgi:hypothetical protein